VVRVDFSLSPDLQPGTQVPSIGQSWPSAWDSSPSLSQFRPLDGTVKTQSLPVPSSPIQSHVWPCHVAVVTLILMPNMPKTECIARIRRKPTDNVRWCVHNKCQQVDLRQYWVVFLPIFPASPGLPPGTQVPVPGSPGLRPGTPVPVYPSPGVRPALPRPSPIQSQPLAGASGPSPGLRPSDWRPVSVRSGTVCGLGTGPPPWQSRRRTSTRWDRAWLRC